MRISQSLIKDYRDYQKGFLCGLLFEALHITRTTKIEPTKAMLLGQFFEFLAIGSINRDMEGKKLGQYFADGLKQEGMKAIDYWDEQLAKGIVDDIELAEKHWGVNWFNLIIQAQHFISACEHYEIKFQAIQEKIEHEENGITYVLVIDLIASFNQYIHPDEGKYKELSKVIIDTKATGLINNKWEDYGWAFESLIFKDKLMVQPIFYSLVWQKKFGEKIPFFFFVHSNTNQVDRKIIEINIGPGCLEDLQVEINEMIEAIDFLNDVGYRASPDVIKCYNCPLKNRCEFRANHPQIKSITLL